MKSLLSPTRPYPLSKPTLTLFTSPLSSLPNPNPNPNANANPNPNLNSAFLSPNLSMSASFKSQTSTTTTTTTTTSGGDPMATSHSHSGEIHVIVGPMFAGKTTALLRRIKSESNNGRNVAMIKSSKDTRYAVDSVVTHDGTKFPCWTLPDLLSFRLKFGADAYDKLDVIGIDEAQFFDDLYDFCCKAADHDAKTIIVAGLDGDYLRRSFGSVLDIIPIADTIMKLTARCELCGRRAFFSLRKTAETQTEFIGGADVYMPVCRQHYVNGQTVMEATRLVMDSHHKVENDRSLDAAAAVV